MDFIGKRKMKMKMKKLGGIVKATRQCTVHQSRGCVCNVRARD